MGIFDTSVTRQSITSKALGGAKDLPSEFTRGTKGQFEAGKEQFGKGAEILIPAIQKYTEDQSFTDVTKKVYGRYFDVYTGVANPFTLIDNKRKPITEEESKILQGLTVSGVGATTAATSIGGGVGAVILPESAEEALGTAITSIEQRGAEEAKARGLEPAFGEAVAGSAAGVGLGVAGAALGGVLKGVSRGVKSKAKTPTDKAIEDVEAIQTKEERTPTIENEEKAEIVSNKIDEFIEKGDLIESPEFLDGIKVKGRDKNGITQLQLKETKPLSLDTSKIAKNINFGKVKLPKGTSVGKEVANLKSSANRLRDVETNKRRAIQLIKSWQRDQIKNPELKKILSQGDLNKLSSKNKQFTDLVLKEAEFYYKQREKIRLDAEKAKGRDRLEKAKKKAEETEAQFKARIDKIKTQNKSKIDTIKTESARRIGEVKDAFKGKETLRKELQTKAKDTINKAFTTGELGIKILGSTDELKKVKGELLNSTLQIKDTKTFDSFLDKFTTIVNKNNYRTVDNRIKAKLKKYKKSLLKTKGKTALAGDSIIALRNVAEGYSQFRKTGSVEDLRKVEKYLDSVIKVGKDERAEHTLKTQERIADDVQTIVDEGVNNTKAMSDLEIVNILEKDKTLKTKVLGTVTKGWTLVKGLIDSFNSPNRSISYTFGGADTRGFKIFKEDLDIGVNNYRNEFHKEVTEFTDKYEDAINDDVDVQSLSIYGQLIQNENKKATNFEDRFAYGLDYIKHNLNLPKSLRQSPVKIEEVYNTVKKNPKSVEAVADFSKRMSKLYDDLSKVYQSIYGEPLPGKRIENYYAVFGGDKGALELLLESIVEEGFQVGKDGVQKGVKKGTKDSFLNNRTGARDHRGGSDFFADVTKMLDSQIYFKHLQKPVVDAYRTLDGLDKKDLLTDGDKKVLTDNLQYFATKGGGYKDSIIVDTLATISYLAVLSALGLKASPIIKQFLSYTDLAELGSRNVLIGANQATRKDLIKFAQDNVAEIRERTLGLTEAEDFLTRYSTGVRAKLKRGTTSYGKFSLATMKYIDSGIAQNVFWGAINKRLVDAGRKNPTDDIDVKTLTDSDIAYGSRMVANKLASGGFQNRPPALRDPLARVFFALQSTMINRLGILFSDTASLWRKGEKIRAAANVAGWMAGTVGDAVISSAISLQKQILGMKETELTEAQEERLNALLEQYPESIRESIKQRIFTEEGVPAFGSEEWVKWFAKDLIGAEDPKGEDYFTWFTEMTAAQAPISSMLVSGAKYDSVGVPAIDFGIKTRDSFIKAYDNATGAKLKESIKEVEDKWKKGEISLQEKNIQTSVLNYKASLAEDNLVALNLIGFFGGDIGKYIESKGSRLSLEDAIKVGRREEGLKIYGE